MGCPPFPHLPESPPGARPTLNLEVIVVDNASTTIPGYITREYPEVRLLALDRNLGLTGGNNLGFRAAKGEFLISLNNDTEAAPAFVEVVGCRPARSPGGGMAAAKMRLLTGAIPSTRPATAMVWTASLQPRRLAARRGPVRPARLDLWRLPAGRLPTGEPCSIKWSIRRIVLYVLRRRDLNWRSQLAGWKCRYAPDAGGLSPS